MQWKEGYLKNLPNPVLYILITHVLKISGKFHWHRKKLFNVKQKSINYWTFKTFPIWTRLDSELREVLKAKYHHKFQEQLPYTEKDLKNKSYLVLKSVITCCDHVYHVLT